MPDIRQFTGSRYARVAGSDLLDEAGAGTRHADDKNRHFGQIPVVLGGRIKLGRAGFDQALDILPERPSIVSRSARRQELTMKRIRLEEEGEGLVASVGVVEQLPQGEAR